MRLVWISHVNGSQELFLKMWKSDPEESSKTTQAVTPFIGPESKEAEQFPRRGCQCLRGLNEHGLALPPIPGSLHSGSTPLVTPGEVLLGPVVRWATEATSLEGANSKF